MNQPRSSEKVPSHPQTRGWWRRNRWGLLAVLPLTAGLVAFNANMLFEQNHSRQPTEPVIVPLGETVRYADAGIRLVELAEVPPTEDLVGIGRTLAPGVIVWRAVVEVDAAEDSGDASCRLYVEDGQGRLYSSSPSQLQGFAAGFFGCLYPDGDYSDDDADAPLPQPYTSTSYFVTPSNVEPVGVRIILPVELPRYLRLLA